jgi:hypothetical protein
MVCKILFATTHALRYVRCLFTLICLNMPKTIPIHYLFAQELQ